jgi:acetylornithine deacetylase/succinyl-diaminopimelate desuccinylase-like protein
MDNVLNFIDSNKARFTEELIDLLKIPSISSDPEHNQDTVKCADWVVNHIKELGFDNARAIKTEGHPIVYGDWLHAGPDAPTVLIYGHYDVQPVDPRELWNSDPFQPQIKNGKIIARGTADDKGQFFIHLKAVEALMKTEGKLPLNVKFIIEGEEEAATSHLDEFIKDNAKLLAADVVLISDTEWFAEGLPTICYALRGLAYMEVELTGPNRDLHSGTFGGGIDNPINTLCWMVSQMQDKYGRITVPGFYDDVLELTTEERDAFKRLPYNEEEYCKDLDIKAVNGEIGYTTLERVWARPSFDLNGIWGGYTGSGSKTVIPSNAHAKFSTRLVPNQDPDDIFKKVAEHLKRLTPPTMKLKIEMLGGGNPAMTPMDSHGVRCAQSALRQAFGTEPVFMREGGSIPIVVLFQEVLNAPAVLLGFGLPSDNIHSPNENFSLDNFFGGIKAVSIFLREFKK